MNELSKALSALKSGKRSRVSVEEEVRLAAQSLRASTEPPKNPIPFMTKRGITQVRTVEMSEDGALYLLDDRSFGADIKVTSSRARQTFTCLHEVGHTYFIDPDMAGKTPRFRIVDVDLDDEQVRDRDPVEERLCNLFAGELLLPKEYVARRILKDHLSWRTIMDISGESGASLLATAIAAIQCGVVKGILSVWKRNAEKSALHLAWQIHSWDLAASVDKRYSPQSDSPIVDCSKSSTTRRIFCGKSFLRVLPRGGDWYYTESCFSSDSAMTLIFFDRSAEVFGSQRVIRRAGQRELF